MLLRTLGIYLLLCGALSQTSPDKVHREHVNGVYQLFLADTDSLSQFASLSSLLEVKSFKAPTLKERQSETEECENPSWVPCPNNPTGCKPVDANCCEGTDSYYFPSDAICCPNYGACPKAYECCPKACCPQGGFCGDNGLCSTWSWTMQTETSTQTSTSTSTTVVTESWTSTWTSTSTAAYTTGGCSTSSPVPRDLEARRYPWETECTEVCHIATGEQIAVLNIKNIPGETDQLIDSTCRGMQARRDNSQIPAGLNDGEDILTYNGKGNRVTTVNCRDFCGDANRATSTGAYQCDEYPPAVFNQEESAQTRLCIERFQNSGTQGPLLKDLVNNCNLQKGQKVLFRVEGGCPSLSSKRDDHIPNKHLMESAKEPRTLHPRKDSSTIFISSSNATLRNPNGDKSLTYVAVDLGALDDGHYNLEVNLDGNVDNVTVLDSDGNTYSNINAPSGPVRLSFDVNTNGSYVPFALIAYTDKATNVSYTGNGTINNSATTVAASATATHNIGARLGAHWSPLIGVFLMTVFTFC